MKIQLSMLVYYKADTITILLNITCSRHDIAEKNTHLALNSFFHLIDKYVWRDRRGRDCTVVGYTTTYAISAYHH